MENSNKVSNKNPVWTKKNKNDAVHICVYLLVYSLLPVALQLIGQNSTNDCNVNVSCLKKSFHLTFQT